MIDEYKQLKSNIVECEYCARLVPRKQRIGGWCFICRRMRCINVEEDFDNHLPSRTAEELEI